jgi:hypothetical protein
MASLQRSVNVGGEITSFVGGDRGNWQIEAMTTIIGGALDTSTHLDMISDGTQPVGTDHVWVLQGVPSYHRYVNRREHDLLTAGKPALGRPEATCAALIPIKKSESWWALPQDERRAILEEQSQHIQIGLRYVPAVARRLYHCHDLGGPFDFLTWFEYAPQHRGLFNELTQRLRDSQEWHYVEREVDIRLVRR